MPYTPNVVEEPKELAYDLRQGLANVLVNILMDIETCMQERDYKGWNEGMDRLFMFISFKLKPKEKRYYGKLGEELNKKIDGNPKVYLKQELEGREIYGKLKKMFMWLVRKMEKYKMFGAKQDMEGLM